MAAEETDERPATGVQDNSFFVEEAYNQDPGVVQHILNIGRSIDRLRGPDEKEWDFLFTQEWPMWSHSHQISYSVPYSFTDSGGRSDNGIGDIFINFRYQVFDETSSRRASGLSCQRGTRTKVLAMAPSATNSDCRSARS